MTTTTTTPDPARLTPAGTSSSPPPPARPGAHERERRRRLVRAVRYAVVGLVLAALLVAAVLAFRPQAVGVDVAHVTRGLLVVAVEETGVARVVDRFVVSAPVTGTVSRLALEPGDAVREGDPLAEIAPASSPLLDERTRAAAEARLGAARSALGQAEAQLARLRVEKERADLELERTKKLSAGGSLPVQALEQAEFLVRMRKEELTSAEFARKVGQEEVRAAAAALGQGRKGTEGDRHFAVLAPASGRVLAVHQKSAGLVQAGTPLVEVGDPARLEVVVDVLSTDAVRITPGTPVVIRGWGGPHDLGGEVRRVEPSAFTRPSALGVEEQRVNVIVALTDPKERRAGLGDGYRVEARLTLWRGDGVLKVPLGALFRRGDGWAVFRVDGGVARLVPVSVGHRGEAEAELTAGLPEGAEVVVHASDRVKDGVRVQVR